MARPHQLAPGEQAAFAPQFLTGDSVARSVHVSGPYKKGSFPGLVAGLVAAAPFAVLYALGTPCRLAPLGGTTESSVSPFVGCSLPLSVVGLLIVGVVYGVTFWVGRTLYRGWSDERAG